MSGGSAWSVHSFGAPSMDLTRQQQQRSLASACRGPLPFPRRPWMSETGVAAATAASGNLGLKGVIAGMLLLSFPLSSLSFRKEERERERERERVCVRSLSRDRSWPADLRHLSECIMSCGNIYQSLLSFSLSLSLSFFFNKCTLLNRTIM